MTSVAVYGNYEKNIGKIVQTLPLLIGKNCEFILKEEDQGIKKGKIVQGA